MQKVLLDQNNVVVNFVELPDDWDAGNASHWQVPANRTIGADGGAVGDTWNGSSYDKPTIPLLVQTDAEIAADLMRIALDDIAAKAAKTELGLAQGVIDELTKKEKL